MLLNTTDLWPLLLIIVCIIPTLIALIDIFKSDFKNNSKLIWLVLVLMFNLFGAVLYFLIGNYQKTTSNET